MLARKVVSTVYNPIMEYHLYRASKFGHLDIVKLILATGVIVTNYASAIEAAKKNGHEDVVQYLQK